VIQAVVDTNILVSGLLSSSGNEALILLAINHGFVRPCLSEPIIAEYEAVLARPKFAFPPDDIAALVAMLRARGELFDSARSSAASPDPADSKFLRCADVARADVLITGNKRHFPNGPYGPTLIVSAGELLDRITLGV
jgi:putative PIN family toxin of toxin-antitoxin system